MAIKKVRELRELTVKELKKMKLDVEEKLFKLRFKSKIERPENPMEKRGLKKTLARVNTLLWEQENNGVEG